MHIQNFLKVFKIEILYFYGQGTNQIYQISFVIKTEHVEAFRNWSKNNEFLCQTSSLTEKSTQINLFSLEKDKLEIVANELSAIVNVSQN